MINETILGSKKYLLANLGLVIFIPMAILVISITLIGILDSFFGYLLFLIFIGIVILSIFSLTKESSGRKLQGLIYETEDKEKYYIYLKETNGEVFVFVNGKLKAQFKSSSFHRNHVTFMLGKTKKHTINAEAVTNLFTGRTDTYLYINGVLAYKVTSPIW